MSDTENLVLEHLRALRADTGDLKSDLRDVKARLASIERPEVTNWPERYIATLHGDQARRGVTVDDLVQRIERLEKRAGITPAISRTSATTRLRIIPASTETGLNPVSVC